MNASPTPRRRTDRRADRGTTLVELMITLVVMSLGAAIVVSALALGQSATNRIERSASAIDSARLVSATLDRELRSAICISQPAENQSGNTLVFQTIATDELVVLTYVVANGSITRSENSGPPRTVISGVGSTTAAFRQVTTPLRTVVVDIPIRSENGGEFRLQTTIAGRNAWHAC